MTEAELLEAVRDLAKRGGWRCYHTHDSRRSEPGFPDLVLCRPPELLYIELKTAAGKLRPEQTEWLAALEQCHMQEALVWRPADLDAAARRLVSAPGVRYDPAGYRPAMHLACDQVHRPISLRPDTGDLLPAARARVEAALRRDEEARGCCDG